MKSESRTILIFGGGELQESIIAECKRMRLFTVVIDPDANSLCRNSAHSFEVVAGDDFDGTCKIVEKYSVSGILTAATDKPLVMMARIAQKYGFPFFSEETAMLCTDKWLMKQAMLENNLPCARGELSKGTIDSLNYPLIIKPRDNSGSRGVVLCRNSAEFSKNFRNTLDASKLDSFIAEEYIDGSEISVESLHFNDVTYLLQITEKTVTPLPQFVELGHIQPANLNEAVKKSVYELEKKVASVFGFKNCASHNEYKIKNGKVFLIEASPRTGGDFISSTLTPNSTGVNMERALISLALGEVPSFEQFTGNVCGVFYFQIDHGIVKNVETDQNLAELEGLIKFKLSLKPGDRVPVIKSSIDRYGYFIITGKDREDLLNKRLVVLSMVNIVIEKIS